MLNRNTKFFAAKWVLGLFLCLFVHFSDAKGQFSRITTETKLLQLGNDSVRVLYPAGLEADAQRVANAVLTMRMSRIRSLRAKPVGKIDILLQAETTIPNAFVALAPRRSEFFLTPMQENLTLGSGSWTDLLAIHEYRHVQQFYNARVGLSKLFYYLSGDFGWLTTSFLAVPDWFWEGDAVVYETALTHGGRGRYPSFLKEYRAFSLENVSISYDQARLGSYVNYSPGHYALGYMMTVYGRNKYRQDLWNDVFRDAASWRVPILGVSRSLKKRTGQNASQFFFYSKAYFADFWRDYETRSEVRKGNAVPVPSSNVITEYAFVHPQADGSLLAMKESFKKTETVVEIRNGKETVLARPGLSLNSWFSANSNWLVWPELRADPRWETRDYSIIMLQNRKTGEKKEIGSKRKLFSPSIHPEFPDSLVAVSIQPGKSPTLVFFDASSGNETKNVVLNDLDFASHVRWDGDGVLFVGKSGQENAVFRRAKDGTLENCTGWTNHPISTPFGADSLIVFTSTFSNTDDIYGVIRGGRRFYRLTTTQLGAYQAQTDAQGNLFFSAFSSRGHKIHTFSANEIQPELVRTQPLEKLENPIKAIADYEGGTVLEEISTRTFESKPYPDHKNLINIHSWTLTGGEPEYTASIYSDNLTATLSSVGSVTYNTNAKASITELTAFYSRYYPVVRFSTRYFNWQDDPAFKNNREIGLGVLIPWRFYVGNYQQLVRLQSDVFVRDATPTSSSYAGAIFSPNAYTRLLGTWTNLRRKARQNPYSRFGYQADVAYRKTLTKDVPLNRFNGEATVFLPGIGDNSNTVFSGAFWRDDNSFASIIDNTFRYPRGYDTISAKNFYRLSANYTGTIAHFHRRFGAMIYANRMRGTVFYDHGWGRNFSTTLTETQLFRSAGAELILDTFWFRLLPLEMIFRGGIRLDEYGKQNSGAFSMITVGVVF